MVRFVHTADWQLGMRRHFLSPEAQSRFTQDRINVIAAIGRIAIERNCAFVAVAGDVFEDNAIDRQVLVRALDAMRAASVPFYLLPGNHDPLNDASVYRSPMFEKKRPPNVTVLQSAEPVDMGGGVRLVGAPWYSKHPLEDLVASALATLSPAPGVTTIAVGHGAYQGMGGVNPALIDLEAVRKHLESGAIHYLGLGDRHSTTDLGVDGRVWYAGAPEPTDYGEVEPGKVLVVDVTPEKCEVERVSTARWRFIAEHHPLNGPEDVDELASHLEAMPDKLNTILKLSFEGTVHLVDSIRLDAVLDEARVALGAVEVWDRHTDLAVISDETDFGALQLSGFAKATLEDLQAQALPGSSNASAADDALALLFRLAGGVA